MIIISICGVNRDNNLENQGLYKKKISQKEIIDNKKGNIRKDIAFYIYIT